MFMTPRPWLRLHRTHASGLERARIISRVESVTFNPENQPIMPASCGELGICLTRAAEVSIVTNRFYVGVFLL
jgi:hypothetical protein